MYNIQNRKTRSVSPDSSNSFVRWLCSKFSGNRAARRLTVYNVAIVSFILLSLVCISVGVYAISDSLDADTQVIENEISDNAGIAIYPFVPDIKVTVDYKGIEYYTFGTPELTVAQLLAYLDIDLSPSDTLNCSLDDLTYNGMFIDIDVNTVKTVTYTEEIAYTTRVIGVDTIPKGTREIVQKGQNGSRETVINYYYVNGELSKNEKVSESVIVQPVQEIIYEGIGGAFINDKGEMIEYSHYIDVVATAYGGGGITFSGKVVAEGMIAVDPTVIPLGSKVYVTGDYADLGICYAEDTGGYIKGNRIDVYMEASVEEQLLFGRRDMRVYIME